MRGDILVLALIVLTACSPRMPPAPPAEAPSQPQPQPAPAETYQGENPTPVCERDAALWSYDDDQDGPPTPRPTHTDTTIWSCRVAGRLMVVKHRLSPRNVGACGAEYVGEVSAWIDGVKVVSHREIGEYAACMGNETLASIGFKAGGELEQCFRTNEARRCEPAHPDLKGAKDQAYLPPEHRTTFAWETRWDLHGGCDTYANQLRHFAASGEDTSFTAAAVPGVPYQAPGVDVADPPTIYRLDVDNDGRPDAVTFPAIMRQHGNEQGGVAWGGPRGDRFHAGEMPRAFHNAPDLTEEDNWFAFNTRVVRLDGRTYVYVSRRDLQYDYGRDLEAVFGARPEMGSLTRGLLELHPDGRTELACGWGPRLRPEEFL